MSQHYVVIGNITAAETAVNLERPVRELSLPIALHLSAALPAIKRGRVGTHKGFMVGVFIGLLAAGLASLAPDRLLHETVQRLSNAAVQAPSR